MPDVTVKRPYPKNINKKSDVEAVQQQILADKEKTGAKSCTLTEDADNYWLTTVYQSAAEAPSAMAQPITNSDMMVTMPDPVKQACEACFAPNANDCSRFARAVAAELGVPLSGQANDIVDTIRNSPDWTRLADGVAAAQQAAAGKLVVGGLRGDEQATPDLQHGHVVIVVAGLPLAHGKYPFAYWGRLGGGGMKDQTINWAWRAEDRDNVTYAAHDIAVPAPAVPGAT